MYVKLFFNKFGESEDRKNLSICYVHHSVAQLKYFATQNIKFCLTLFKDQFRK